MDFFQVKDEAGSHDRSGVCISRNFKDVLIAWFDKYIHILHRLQIKESSKQSSTLII